MPKKNVETETRVLKVKRETVRLLSVKTADLQNVAGGKNTTSDEDHCQTRVQTGTL